jgi:hypothetical protein
VNNQNSVLLGIDYCTKDLLLKMQKALETFKEIFSTLRCFQLLLERHLQAEN